jgi:ABC-type Zn uptake system ZnuABC Zn-binding protein ZnuA
MTGFRILAAWLAIALLLGACTAGQPAANNGLRVVATTSFLADIAQHVAGDRLTVESLLPAGVDPHEYQLSPRDMTKVEDSQVLIVNGLGYETWLQNTLDNAGGKRELIVASDGLSPRPDPTGEFADGDPHMWMDPKNVIHYVENIRDGLTLADPTGKEVYAANAGAYIAKLQELDQWIRNEVGRIPAGRRLLVTNHEALGYYADAYGFTVVGTVVPGLSTDASPSARDLAGLVDTIRKTGAPAIFLDIAENQTLAQQIAGEAGIRVVTGLYLETISAPDGSAPDYIGMLRYDTGLIVSALK